MEPLRYQRIKFRPLEVKPLVLTRDTDRDGVPDFRDCQPFNPNKQGKIHDYLSATKEKISKKMEGIPYAGEAVETLKQRAKKSLDLENFNLVVQSESGQWLVYGTDTGPEHLEEIGASLLQEGTIKNFMVTRGSEKFYKGAAKAGTVAHKLGEVSSKIEETGQRYLQNIKRTTHYPKETKEYLQHMGAGPSSLPIERHGEVHHPLNISRFNPEINQRNIPRQELNQGYVPSTQVDQRERIFRGDEDLPYSVEVGEGELPKALQTPPHWQKESRFGWYKNVPPFLVPYRPIYLPVVQQPKKAISL